MNKERIQFKDHEEMEKYLFTKYPIIFGDRTKPMSETTMCWGICTGIGWSDLLDKVCEEAQLIANVTGIQMIADQVKEKYGSLRWYFHTIRTPVLPTEDTLTDEQSRIWHNIIDDLVQQAEDKSEHTCEECGEYGKVCGTGWYRTLCKTCADKDERYKYNDKDDVI